MKRADHQRAQQFIDACQVEGISPEERTWLDSHLSACEPCSQHAGATERAIQAFRSVHIDTDPALVQATQARVRARAREIHEEAERMRPVWISAVLALVVTVASAPYIWQGLEWLAGKFGAPAWVFQFGFFWFWLIPCLVAAAALAGGLLGEQHAERFQVK
ncbi:MAG: hypothetical protein O7F56_06925 [Acidobacteria bacterium]|nr:hypothetical protein [Acidobacteriota bacterium]